MGKKAIDSPSDTTSGVIKQFAESWVRIANTLEKQGLPFLTSLFLVLLIMPFFWLRVVQQFFTNHFVFIKGISCYAAASWLFVLSLVLGLTIQKLWRTSTWYLKHTKRTLQQLVTEGVITPEERRRAIRILLAYYVLNKLPRNLTDADIEKLKKMET